MLEHRWALSLSGNEPEMKHPALHGECLSHLRISFHFNSSLQFDFYIKLFFLKFILQENKKQERNESKI